MSTLFVSYLWSVILTQLDESLMSLQTARIPDIVTMVSKHEEDMTGFDISGCRKVSLEQLDNIWSISSPHLKTDTNTDSQ